MFIKGIHLVSSFSKKQSSLKLSHCQSYSILPVIAKPCQRISQISNSFSGGRWRYMWSTSWWLTYPSEKYEFVNWDDDSQLNGKLKSMFQSPPTRPNKSPFSYGFPMVFPSFEAYLDWSRLVGMPPTCQTWPLHSTLW